MHSSILAWRISWAEEPGGLQFMGSQRVRHNLATKNNANMLHKEQEPDSQLSAWGLTPAEGSPEISALLLVMSLQEGSVSALPASKLLGK